jgi:hypothetical protein
VEVRPVRSRRERREFVELPFRLHANAPQWVPPLRLERRLFLTPRANAFFKHGEAELLLAWRDGRVCGRLTAHVDHAFNEHHGNKWGMFGFVELEDDPEILPPLLDAAGHWLSERGRDRLVGPMDFTMNEGAGVLVDGFERRAVIRQPWHPPYYVRRCEEAGLTKAMDLYMWDLDVTRKSDVLPVIWDLAEKLEPEHGIRIRHMRRRDLRRDLDRFAEVYNEAWSESWGFSPYSKEDLDHYALELHLAFDPAWFMVAETADGDTAGVAITGPDLNLVLQRMNGRLLPLGWWHFLRRRKIIDRCRVGFLGVRPAYQHTGVAAGLYAEHWRMAEDHPIKGGELGWVLETNDALNKGMEAMGAKVVKRFRMYERPVGSG